MEKDSFQDVFEHTKRLDYFSPIDFDTPGGFARVVRVTLKSPPALLASEPLCAFKIMRHNLHNPSLGRAFFQKELEVLRDFDAHREGNPLLEMVTRVYDSGFVERRVSEMIDQFGKPTPDWPIIRTGLDPIAFRQAGAELSEEEWVPFLMVEMAGYNDSLFRQIKQRIVRNDIGQGLFRLPTCEVLLIATQLLDLISWMHEHLGRAYIDWKPEHVHWNGMHGVLKVIDWNVTSELDNRPGRLKNIRDDVRLLSGAVLYCGLTASDPEDGRPIGPAPTRDHSRAIDESRRRYLATDVNFYEAGAYLDPRIKAIISRALSVDGYENPVDLKTTLVEYAKEELGLDMERVNELSSAVPGDQEIESDIGLSYWTAIRNIRDAQQQLTSAYRHLRDATGMKGDTPEFDRLLKLLNNIQRNYPVP